MGSLALATLVAGTYSAIQTQHALYLIGTNLFQVFLFSAISWVLFGIGEKKGEVIFIKAKPFVYAGLLTWAMSTSIFRLLSNTININLVSAVVPLLLVGGLSYFSGLKGGLGFSNENR